MFNVVWKIESLLSLLRMLFYLPFRKYNQKKLLKRVHEGAAILEAILKYYSFQN